MGGVAPRPHDNAVVELRDSRDSALRLAPPAYYMGAWEDKRGHFSWGDLRGYFVGIFVGIFMGLVGLASVQTRAQASHLRRFRRRI